MVGVAVAAASLVEIPENRELGTASIAKASLGEATEQIQKIGDHEPAAQQQEPPAAMSSAADAEVNLNMFGPGGPDGERRAASQALLGLDRNGIAAGACVVGAAQGPARRVIDGPVRADRRQPQPTSIELPSGARQPCSLIAQSIGAPSGEEPRPEERFPALAYSDPEVHRQHTVPPRPCPSCSSTRSSCRRWRTSWCGRTSQAVGSGPFPSGLISRALTPQ
ncbi:unnamed protein product [Vitrella brassicaformis CCMP3155]|uniref:Uncharacterized protein n=1 Tax=Vitrella brassicaformis (strain CCMP3155) TaxID=1169540 RepID=A0A0G4FNR9_VITBC|nr:unnamed protein product [Vitrella brassicaformis CCMP3155]|eukprot:CEM15873.1 unnamed protein product [Vitrella brassicaformis CCMP3155]